MILIAVLQKSARLGPAMECAYSCLQAMKLGILVCIRNLLTLVSRLCCAPRSYPIGRTLGKSTLGRSKSPQGRQPWPRPSSSTGHATLPVLLGSAAADRSATSGQPLHGETVIPTFSTAEESCRPENGMSKHLSQDSPTRLLLVLCRALYTYLKTTPHAHRLVCAYL